MIQNILIAYFSGTGGTALAAKRLAEALEDRGASVTLREIRKDAETGNGNEDYFALLFPVHAFNAPLPVYRWLESLDSVNGTSAAVISVSSGGEMSPNTACRRSCIKRLRKRGYTVIYEESLVMPSNVLVKTPESALIKLLQVLPKKSAGVAADIIAGRKKELKARLLDRFLSQVGEMEKLGAKMFGRHLIAGPACNNCGWCARNCPAGNIFMEERPVFGRSCSMCLRCVYGCPENAIKPKFIRSLILKEGLDIGALLKKAEEIQEHESEDLPKGVAWKGVRRYLDETEKSFES